MRATARLLAPTLLLAATLLAGCGSGPSIAGQQAAAATAAPTATSLPSSAPIPEAFRGTWTTQLAAGGQSHGAWKLRITADDVELLNPAATSDAEYFSLNPVGPTQDGVSFADDPDCQGATYRWTLDGDTLTLSAVGSDPCSDRFDTLAGSAWHRSK